MMAFTFGLVVGVVASAAVAWYLFKAEIITKAKSEIREVIDK